MTAKEFLRRFFVLQCSVNIMLEQIERFQSVAIQTTAVVKGIVSGNSAASSRVENSVVNIYEKMDCLADDLAHVLELRDKVTEAISRVDNSQERILLELRYLCLYPWDKIAKMMLFSTQRAFQIHQQALENFRVPEKIRVN